MRDKIQEDSVQDYLNSSGKGILQIAQRVGKIKLSLDILEKLFDYHPTVLIAYPDNRIMDSWVEDFEKWGFKKVNNITFCNYMSLDKYQNMLFDFVIFDECHSMSPRVLEISKEIIFNNKRILGLSGTISKETESDLLDIGLPILKKYSLENAIQDDIIADYKVFIHRVNLDTTIKVKNKKGKMVSEKQKYDNYTSVINSFKREGRDFKFLALHRNRVLQDSHAKKLCTLRLLAKLKHNRTLVFTGLKKSCEALGIPYYHSTSNNPGIFDDFRTGKIIHLAVVNIGRAGVSFKDLEVIVIQSFTGNEETTEQILARALIKDKDTAEIHIIVSTEEAELKKLQKTLINIPENKIKWL